jgi:carbon monoxide dehydrogenase subunit G
VDITGSYSFAAAPDRVWTLLMDPVVIASCIPGCEALVPDGVDRYRARITMGLAAITGTYEGTVVITEKVDHTSYRLAVDGQGKPGFAKGSALITLRPDGAGTVVDVSGTVQTGGAMARLGQRLIGAGAKMMQDRFFACMQQKVLRA